MKHTTSEYALRFPYTVRINYMILNDGICCSEVADSTGHHFRRCKNAEKELIDGIGFCKIHANGIKKWRRKTNGNKSQS